MSAFDQGRYQVRLDWGVEGVERLAPADVYVVVDALGTLSGAFDGSDRDLAVAGDDGARALAAAAAVEQAPLVLLAGLRNATATARAMSMVEAAERRRSHSIAS